ncbi:MAG: hypothetical protein M1813_000989 [Trichoglossum hirsutum]|nr:MAG: hypothetical protein M1813_000989 [Trichoglossum hirsutum]
MASGKENQPMGIPLCSVSSLGVKTIDHVRFQVSENIPWLWKRYIWGSVDNSDEPRFMRAARAQHTQQQQQQQQNQVQVELQSIQPPQVNDSDQIAPVDPNLPPPRDILHGVRLPHKI